jgi:hypothetical protein
VSPFCSINCNSHLTVVRLSTGSPAE